MKRTLKLLFCLFVLTSTNLNSFAQNKITHTNNWNFTKKDFAKINKALFEFIEFDNIDLNEVPIYFENVPVRFKKQLISKIKSLNKNINVIILNQKNLTEIKLLDEKNEEVLLSISTNQKIIYKRRKNFYLEIKFVKNTAKTLSISVASYSSCYSTGETYTLQYNKNGFSRRFDFVGECGFGCKDGVCQPPPDRNPIKMKTIIDDDDPPPPFIKLPLKIIKPNE